MPAHVSPDRFDPFPYILAAPTAAFAQDPRHPGLHHPSSAGISRAKRRPAQHDVSGPPIWSTQARGRCEEQGGHNEDDVGPRQTPPSPRRLTAPRTYWSGRTAQRLRSRSAWSAHLDGNAEYYRNSGTLLLRNGQWQVVTWQATKVAPAAEEKPLNSRATARRALRSLPGSVRDRMNAIPLNDSASNTLVHSLPLAPWGRRSPLVCGG